MWIVDAHRDAGKRFVVRAEEMLTAFLELGAATRGRQSDPWRKMCANSVAVKLDK
jgi:hypothetical protein